MFDCGLQLWKCSTMTCTEHLGHIKQLSQNRLYIFSAKGGKLFMIALIGRATFSLYVSNMILISGSSANPDIW